jgi:hypothetical protein
MMHRVSAFVDGNGSPGTSFDGLPLQLSTQTTQVTRSKPCFNGNTPARNPAEVHPFGTVVSDIGRVGTWTAIHHRLRPYQGPVKVNERHGETFSRTGTAAECHGIRMSCNSSRHKPQLGLLMVPILFAYRR